MAQRSLRGWRWNVVRSKVIRLAGFKCRRCGNGGRLEVHHIVALSKGGKPYDMGNLEAICRRCHFDEHRHDRSLPGAKEWREYVGR